MLIDPMPVFVAGAAHTFAKTLAQSGLYTVPWGDARFLINADPAPDAEVVVARCREFAQKIPPGEEALIVTILHNPPQNLAAWPAHQANAALWAFTRLAALEWAGTKIRVNAIGLGAAPFTPWEPIEQAGRAATSLPAAPATQDDIVRTLAAMTKFRSMTGQIIRLGA